MSSINSSSALQGRIAGGQKEEISEDQIQLLNILNNTTQLYIEMLKINLELKKLPTVRAGVIRNDNLEVM